MTTDHCDHRKTRSDEPRPTQGKRRRSAEDGFTPLRRSAEHGFTLVELMVVIVIIGLLATIVAINVHAERRQGEGDEGQADIATDRAARSTCTSFERLSIRRRREGLARAGAAARRH